jgi:hypothetical protein
VILTPVIPAELPIVLAVFRRGIRDAASRRVFDRLARRGQHFRATGSRAEAHRRAALALARSFGMGVRSGPPSAGFSWDGRALRGATEAYVLLHEVAHFQLAAPRRRRIVDFGLGAGPETGARAAADRAAQLFGVAREREEAMASLLGVLWEAELGQPALASFLDQNWLDSPHRPQAAAHFADTLGRLRAGGFVTHGGRPTRRLRHGPDD